MKRRRPRLKRGEVPERQSLFPNLASTLSAREKGRESVGERETSLRRSWKKEREERKCFSESLSIRISRGREKGRVTAYLISRVVAIQQRNRRVRARVNRKREVKTTSFTPHFTPLVLGDLSLESRVLLLLARRGSGVERSVIA